MGSEFRGLLLLLVFAASIPFALRVISRRSAPPDATTPRGTGSRGPLRMPASFTRHALGFPLLLCVLMIVIPGLSLVRQLGTRALVVLVVFVGTVVVGVVYARRKGGMAS